MNNPEIELTAPDHESSQINRTGYSPDHRVMVIEFKARPGNPNAVYHYQHVSPMIYNDLRTADSPGSVLARTIKANPIQFPAHKVTDEDCGCFDELAEVVAAEHRADLESEDA